MKLNKTFGRVATTLVAAAMLASLAVVPASAETAPVEGVFNNSTITMTKNLEMPKDVVVPNVDFKFDIKPGSTTNDEKYTDSDGVSIPVTAGTATKINAGTATIDANATITEAGDKKTASTTFTLELPEEEYKEVGVYKYTIDEQDVSTADGYIDKTVSLDLYLIVTRDNDGAPITDDDNFVVSAAVITGSGNKQDKKATWLNYYKLSDDGESNVGTITVQKKIAGAMGNKSDTFEFTVAGLKENVDYTYKINDVVQNDKLNNTNNKVDLGHEDTLEVIGLEDGTFITITEDIPEASGYECESVTGDEDDVNEGCNMNVVAKQTKSAVFTNTREAVSPTGLAMDIAPYALLVVVAAAGCFVFLRKRSED